MVHVTSGVGCVVDSDSPWSLSLRSGDRLFIQHLPRHRTITPLFIPSLVVAENTLRISGFRYHTDYETRERVRKGVGRDRVYERSSYHLTLNKKKFPSKHTENKKTSIKFSQNISRSKRKPSPFVRVRSKRTKIPLTQPPIKSDYHKSSYSSPIITGVTNNPKSDQMRKFLQNPKSGRYDERRGLFRPIQDDNNENSPVRSRKDKGRNKDFAAMIEHYEKYHENDIYSTLLNNY